jgi:histidine triad (HIT) family protein
LWKRALKGKIPVIPMNSCIFCNILGGNAAANFVMRNEWCAAFMDIHPVNPGHVLVVPLYHAELLSGLDEPTLGHMLQMAQRIDGALRKTGLKCEGVNLYLADGRPAGQEVMHVHLHVIPRFHGDGHHLRFSPAYFTRPSTAELEQTAQQIRQQLEEHK